MKLVQLSTNFLPRLGGMEMIAAMLHREFLAMGHNSSLITRTLASINNELVDERGIQRRPSSAKLIRLLAKADAIVCHGMPLRLAWPLLFLRKPSLIVKNMWDPPRGPGTIVRQALERRGVVVTVSRHMQRILGTPIGAFIPNPYDDTIFYEPKNLIERDRDIIFVGRLTYDKGSRELLPVLQLLADWQCLRVTIIGDGPERNTIADQITSSYATNIRLLGPTGAVKVAEELRRHKVFVFPALWDEPFGIVGLEAIACGTVVTGYRSGGFTEAVGSCGVLVPQGDRAALAQSLQRLLVDTDYRASLLSNRAVHLEPHRARAVAEKYCEWLSIAARGSRA